MHENNKRAVALVFLGIIPGFIPAIIKLPTIYAVTVAIIMAIGFIFCLFYGIGIIQQDYHNHLICKRGKQPFKIGILSDMGDFKETAEYFVWTDVKISTWKNSLMKLFDKSKTEAEIKEISVKENFHRYTAILNPYGACYPEQNLKTLSTHNKIIEFVREGGLFVNVADIPTYYSYNPILKRRLDNTPPIYATVQKNNRIDVVPYRFFHLTPMMKELGLRGVNTEPLGIIEQNLNSILGLDSKFVAARSAIIESNVTSAIPTINLRYQDGNNYDMSSLIFVKYGEGEFLLSLAFINDKNHTDKEKQFLINAIIRLTQKKIFELYPL